MAIYILLQKDLKLHPQNNNASASTNSTDIKKSSHNKLIMRLALLCVLLVGSVVSQLSSTYSIYIKNIFPELGITAVSVLFMINSLMVVLFEVPIGNFFSDYNKIFMVGLGGLFIGLGMCMLSFSHVFLLAVIACIVYTLGEIIFFCMVQLVCYQKADNRKKGRSLGLYRAFYGASRIIGPAAGGFIYYHISGEMVWYISGLIGIMCFAACAKFMKYY